MKNAILLINWFFCFLFNSATEIYHSTEFLLLSTHWLFFLQNYMRVADVWMDEYKEYILKRRPHYRDIDPGDLTQQRAIREKLQCKNFKWFMTEVAFDLTKKYPPVEPPDYASGEVSLPTSLLALYAVPKLD